MDRRSHSLRISTYFFALFLVYGIWVPFLPVWLEGRGLGAEQIGLVFAAALWAKIPFGVGLTSLADQTGQRRNIVIVIAFCVLAGFVAFQFKFGFVFLMIGWLILGSLLTTSVPLVDSLAILSANRTGLNYGAVRRWGSVSFVIASVGGGWYLGGRDSETILTLLILASLTLVAVSLILPNLRLPPRTRKRPAMFEILRSPTFRLFAMSAALLQASHATLYGFASLHWKQAGISESTIGLLWAEGVVAEIILFSLAGLLIKKLGPTKLMLMAAMGGIIRWTVLGMTTDLELLIATQILHAFTFSATHVAAFAFIMQTVPEEQSASAQGLYDSLALGMFFGIAMALAGWTYEVSGSATFFVMTSLSAAGGIGTLFLIRRMAKA